MYIAVGVLFVFFLIVCTVCSFTAMSPVFVENDIVRFPLVLCPETFQELSLVSRLALMSRGSYRRTVCPFK